MHARTAVAVALLAVGASLPRTAGAARPAVVHAPSHNVLGAAAGSAALSHRAVTAATVVAGPMAGHATPRTATLWVQLSAPGSVVFEYWPVDRPTDRAKTAPILALSTAGHIVHAVADQVVEAQQYAYRVLVDGAVVALDRPLLFRTPPRSADPFPLRDLRIAFGSCAMIADPTVDPPGQTPGGDYQIFDAIAAQRPDLMLWGGDNVYFRDADWTSILGMRRRYAQVRALPALQRLLGATNHYAAWDDHDYGPNDADRSWVGKRDAKTVFAEYWANPTYGVPGAEEGVGTSFRWGDVEFFLMDDRTYRAPNYQRGGDGDYWGAGQLHWLIDALRASTATFKLVVNGGQVVSPLPIYENMANYARERSALFELLARDPVDGVMFLSGDRHVTELTKMPRPGLYPLYDATISPLTSGAFGGNRAEPNPWRVDGTWVPARNFATLDVTGPRGDRVLTIIVRDVDGVERWRHTIPHRELRVAR
jgi:alkaline phosphatase D